MGQLRVSDGADLLRKNSRVRGILIRAGLLFNFWTGRGSVPVRKRSRGLVFVATGQTSTQCTAL
jgi:hypothetical protein